MSDVETLFGEALQRDSAEQRASFLDHACGTDSPVRMEIDALLAAHDRAGQFMESPALILDQVACLDSDVDVRPSNVELPGAIIGPYKLLEQIGEGGMGMVYVAEQLRPVRRRIALKIIKPGLDTRQVIARFEAERQALAMMDHPNIARVLDAGATDAGRPYFAMELVRGAPITEYCDEHNLTPRQRLELFTRVCQAVQHAHQKGIIHRDLKPGNVLVTLGDDGKPFPKVIDFGIAKATGGQPLTDRTLFTQFHQFVGTPLYMSPEQVEPAASDVDTRADIYSLGVLLYELLTGTTPFDRARLAKAAQAEVRRIIRDEEPPKPSTRLSTLGEKLSSVSAQRQTDAKKLSQTIRGELDWIVMKALDKDRGRRYETANGLARDIERYLDDQPVEACPPTRLYQLRKFARRNRWALTTAAVLFVVLGAAASITTWQAVRATRAHASARAAEQQSIRERDAALREKARADEHAALSDGLARFFGLGVIGQASPEQSAKLNLPYDPKLTVRAALDRAADGIGNWPDNMNNPMLEAEVREKVAGVYVEIGDFAKARELYERSLAIRRQHRGIEDRGTLRCMSNLAIAYRSTGQPEQAEALYLDVIRLAQGVLGDYDNITVLAHQNLASLYGQIGRWAEAEHHLVRSYGQGVTESQPYQVCLWVEIYLHKRDVNNAQAIVLQNLPKTMEVTGEQSLHTMWLNERLARTYGCQGRLPEAESLFLNVLAGYRRFTDGKDNDDSRRVMAYLMGVYEESGKHQHAAEIATRLAEAGDAAAQVRLGRMYLEGKGVARDANQALRWLHEAVQRDPGVQEFLGKIYAQGIGVPPDPAEAAKWYRGLAMYWQHNVATSAEASNALAWLLATCEVPAIRDIPRALTLAEQAIRLRPTNALYWNTLGVARYRAREYSRAIEALNKSREVDPNGNLGADGLFLAMAHWQLGQKAEARRWHRDAVAWMEQRTTDDLELQGFRAEAADLLGVATQTSTPAVTRTTSPAASPTQGIKP